MADTVYTVEEIQLQDGTEVQLRPAVIKVLRKGNKIMEGLVKTQDEDEAIDVLLKAAVVCLEPHIEGFNFEIAEDVLDMATIHKVLDICLGIRLNDPKVLEAAAAMTEVMKGK